MRLDELEFARVMPLVCWLPPASTMFPSELSEARLAYGMKNILVIVVDELFDVGDQRKSWRTLSRWSKSTETHLTTYFLQIDSDHWCIYNAPGCILYRERSHPSCNWSNRAVATGLRAATTSSCLVATGSGPVAISSRPIATGQSSCNWCSHAVATGLGSVAIGS